jgi:hypothetical protein
MKPKSKTRVYRAVCEALDRRQLLSFATPVQYPAPNDHLVTADLNGDGRLDLAGTSPGGNVGVLLGNANGTFGAMQQFPEGTSPIALVVGDMNNDARPDLVIAGGGDVFGDTPGTLNVLLNNGNGTFQPPLSVALPGRFPSGYTGTTARPQIPSSVAVGDVNADGKLDLVAIAQAGFRIDLGIGYYGGHYYEDHYETLVNVLLGHGNGTFAAAATTTLAPAEDANPGSVLKDLNGDGKLDLLRGGNAFIDFCAGNGNGTFAPAVRSPVTAFLNLSGDFDNDGKQDFLGPGDPYPFAGTFLKGVGNGTFVDSHLIFSLDYPIGAAALSTVVGDVNGDGKLDLAALTVQLQADGYNYDTGEAINPRTTESAVVVLGHGDGSFALPVTTTFGTTPGFRRPSGAANGDFNGDNRPDLAAGHLGPGAITSIDVARNLNDWAAPPPGLRIDDVTVVEGDAGTTNAVFTVTLVDGPSNQNVTVNYASTAQNGDAIPDVDFTSVSGTLTFLPSQKTRTITVAVKGDGIDEFDQPFYVALSGATGGGAQILDGEGKCTIIDNDATPTLVISDVVKKEGNSGRTDFVFTLSLSHPSEKGPGVGLIISDGTATSQEFDWDPWYSVYSVYFYNTALTTAPFSVSIYGDRTVEPSEMFFVDVYDPTHAQNVIVADAHAVGIILDDDGSAKTWVGPASGGNWSTSANWSPSGVPGSTHDVVINGNVTVNVAGSIDVRGLTLAGGASLNVGAAGNRVVRTSGLAIDGKSKLNLGDNDLIFDYSTNSSLYPAPPKPLSFITPLIGSGSISRAQALASGGVTALGIAEASEVLGITGTQTKLFAGQAVDSTTALVKCTYGGDANLDGKINVDDYGHIDTSVGLGLTGWFNGDFNYDGTINIDDYGIIDVNVGIQGPPLGNVPVQDSNPAAAGVPAVRPVVTWVAFARREEGSVRELL